MNKTFQPQEIEQRLYQEWEQAGYFKHRHDAGNSEPYCIMLPPPNVTGTLHMGHGFQVTLMDALVRYNRMCQKNTLWQGGTDHAGIATQMVVEQQLLKENKSRHDLGREKFIERVWEWKHSSDSTIKGQLRRMGASLDWSRERFTMDEGIASAVQEVFIRLYNEGLIYRGETLVNWDNVLHTAVSDLEVINVEEKGHLWYIRYPIVNSQEHVVVATTRPETMLGDTGVGVHPDDERYQHLIGQYVRLPLCNREIPIIADSEVLADFGTGCVKLTPGHDFNDHAMGKRHDLPVMNIFTPQATLNEHVPTQYRGLDRFDARAKIIKDLEKLNLIEKTEPHTLKIPRGEKSNTVIEPYLMEQWFVKTKPLAEPAIAAVKRGEIEFVPENWTKIYFQWLENIQDWCISRQIWWGHRIPAWYDNHGKVYVGKDEADVRKKYKLDHKLALKQDDDVLDTWFSSALWPFVTLDWPEETYEFKTFYPTDVLMTGFDIIFFWVARMIMMGLKFAGNVPFKKVYITGLIRDSEGQKMSKSKGNVLDPIDLIDGIDLESLVKKRTVNMMQPKLAQKIESDTRKEYPDGIPPYGTDALRFTYCALATHGRDIRFDLGRIDGYRNFTNKIWNAARYVLMNCEGHEIPKKAIKFTDPNLSIYDRWIRAKLQVKIAEIHRAFAEYRFDWVAQAIYEFIWNEYCDWYLEFSKSVLMSDNNTAEQKTATRQTLVTVLEKFLRLIHPLMPFISEEIWQKVSPVLGMKQYTIMLQQYPAVENEDMDSEVTKNIDFLKAMILTIRNIRGENNISPGKKIPVIVKYLGDVNKLSEYSNMEIKSESGEVYRNIQFHHSFISQHMLVLKSLCKVESITLIEHEQAPNSATAVLEDLEILIPLAGLIDTTAEMNRLKKEITKLETELTVANIKLGNPNFTEKAPAEVVEKEKFRVAEINSTLLTLQHQVVSIENMTKE